MLLLEINPPPHILDEADLKLPPCTRASVIARVIIACKTNYVRPNWFVDHICRRRIEQTFLKIQTHCSDTIFHYFLFVQDIIFDVLSQRQWNRDTFFHITRSNANDDAIFAFVEFHSNTVCARAFPIDYAVIVIMKKIDLAYTRVRSGTFPSMRPIEIVLLLNNSFFLYRQTVIFGYTKHCCPRSICRYRLRLTATASLSECRTVENHWFAAVQQVHNIGDGEWVILCRRHRWIIISHQQHYNGPLRFRHSLPSFLCYDRASPSVSFAVKYTALRCMCKKKSFLLAKKKKNPPK